MKTWLSQITAHYYSGTTAFLEYAPLLSAIKLGTLDHKTLRDLGYFPDPELNSIGKTELKNRLADNHDWFDKISTLHQYSPDIAEDLDKDFNETGKNRLKADDFWDTCTYGEVKKWHEDKKNKVPPAYISKEDFFTDQGLTYWEKAEAETGAKSRKHHIVIFNPEINPRVEFSLMFDREIISSGIQASSKKGNLVGSKAGENG